MATAKEICKRVPSRLLESRVTEHHIGEIANNLVEWEIIAPYLNLTEAEQQEIHEDYPGRYNLQKREALRKWQQKSEADGANYRALIEILCSQRLVLLAEMIVDDLVSNRTPPVFDTFNKYLIDCYNDLLHPSAMQWPSNIYQFSPQVPGTFFDLTLHKAPLNDIATMGTQASSIFTPVQLSDVFSIGNKANGGKVTVLFEGIAGAGKTTLSWYACREWAAKRLLQQYKLLIHVQLKDPLVQSASTLSDLVPYPKRHFCEEVASAILHEEGRGVCFLLDGLDDASDQLLKFLCRTIRENISVLTARMPKLSFIMTSRPNACVLASLQRVLNTKIVIEGFSAEKLNMFFNESLGAESDEKLQLKERFRVNPQLEAICYLPINAVVMAFIAYFFPGDEFPITQTGLYKPLISHFLIRHFQTRVSEEDLPAIEDFSKDIPPEIEPTFRLLCNVAYSALMKNKKVFSLKMLDQAKIKLGDSLGLLQVHPKITMFGQERYYSFPHLSVQEFLAAVYLSQMESSAQLSSFKEVFSSDPLSQVLTFYAGLTGLTNKSAFKILTEVHHRPLNSSTIFSSLSLNPTPANDPRRKAIAMFKCVYECQDSSLLDTPEAQLPILESAKQHNKEVHHYILDLNLLGLLPIDCLAIGYFARLQSLRMPESARLMVMVGKCSDFGMATFMKELRKGVNKVTPARVRIYCMHNNPGGEMLRATKELLHGESNVEALMLLSHESSSNSITSALKSILEGLYTRSSCIDISLQLYDCFCPYHVYFLILLIRILQHQLILCDFDMRHTMQLLCEAFRLSTLVIVTLDDCNIDDSALLQLGSAICTSAYLEVLNVHKGNFYTCNGLVEFLVYFINPDSVLAFLCIDENILLMAMSMMEFHNVMSLINESRLTQNKTEFVCFPGRPIATEYQRRSDGQGWANIERLSRKHPNIMRDTDS